MFFIELAIFFIRYNIYKSGPLERFFLWSFFYTLNSLYKNWRKILHPRKNWSVIKDSRCSLIFDIFLLVLRFWTYELLYIYYRIGSIVIFFNLIFLIFYPFFYRFWWPWFIGWFFFYLLILFLYSLPIDATCRPYNPYFKMYYELYKSRNLHFFFKLFSFQQLMYAVPVTLFFIVFEFFYFLLCLWLMIKVPRNLLEVGVLVFAFFFFNYAFLVISKFFFSKLFFVIRILFIILNRVLCFFVLFKKKYSRKDWTLRNAVLFMKDDQSIFFLDGLENYLCSKYFGPSAITFLRTNSSSTNTPLGPENLAEYLWTLEELDEMYSDDEYDFNFDVLGYPCEDPEDTMEDVYFDTDQWEWYFDLECFFFENMESREVYFERVHGKRKNETSKKESKEKKKKEKEAKSSIDTDEVDSDEYDEPTDVLSDGKQYTYSGQHYLGDMEVLKFKPFVYSASDFRLLIIEDVYYLRGKFRLQTERKLVSSFIKDASEFDWESEDFDLDQDQNLDFDFLNFISATNAESVYLFRSFLRQIVFESQSQFCVFFRHSEKHSYRVFVDAQLVRRYLIRTQFFYDVNLADRYRSIFFRSLINRIISTYLSIFVDSTEILLRLAHKIPVNRSANKFDKRLKERTRFYESLVVDLPNIVNLKLVSSPGKWQVYCSRLREGGVVDYYDLVNRLFIADDGKDLFMSDLEERAGPDDFLRKWKQAEPFLLKNTLFKGNRGRRKTSSRKLFLPSSFFLDRDGRKQFYTFEYMHYDFLNLSNKDFENFIFFLTHFSNRKESFQIFASLFVPFRLSRAFQEFELCALGRQVYFGVVEALSKTLLQRKSLDGFSGKFMTKPMHFTVKHLFFGLERLFSDVYTPSRKRLGNLIGFELLQTYSYDTDLKRQLYPSFTYFYTFEPFFKVKDYSFIFNFVLKHPQRYKLLKLILRKSNSLRQYYSLSAGATLMEFFPRYIYKYHLDSKSADLYLDEELAFYWERDYISTFSDLNSEIDWSALLYNYDLPDANMVLFQRFLDLTVNEYLFSKNFRSKFIKSFGERSKPEKGKSSQDYREFLLDEGYEETFYSYHWTHSSDWRMPSLKWHPPAFWRPPVDWRPPKGWRGPSEYWIPPKVWEPPVWWNSKWPLPKAYLERKRRLNDRFKRKFKS